MRRSMLIASMFVLTAILPFASRSQGFSFAMGDVESTEENDSIPPQRIGLPPMEMEISEGSSGRATGYCFDEYLIAPRRTTSFRHVLAGDNDAVVRLADGREVSLSAAIAKRLVSVVANQLTVQFANYTGAPLSIHFPKAVVLWDRKGGAVNPDALAVLERRGGYDERQEMVWRYTTAERLLGVLGYDKGSAWEYDADRLRSSVLAYQADNGMQTTGQLDETTLDRIAHSGMKLQRRLASLGFRDREGNSLKEDLAAQIRSFERSSGAKLSGRWVTENDTRLASLESARARDRRAGERGTETVSPGVRPSVRAGAAPATPRAATPRAATTTAPTIPARPSTPPGRP